MLSYGRIFTTHDSGAEPLENKIKQNLERAPTDRITRRRSTGPSSHG